jgi:hypothetical protein
VTEHLRLFTARYANPSVATSGLVAVGISRYSPRFPLPYEIAARLYDLAPSAELLAKAKKNLPREDFLQEYEGQLTRIGLQDILRQLATVQGGARGVVLLCFEDLTSGGSCHRTMLADWLTRMGGIAVTELSDPGKKPVRRKATPDPPVRPC